MVKLGYFSVLFSLACLMGASSASAAPCVGNEYLTPVATVTAFAGDGQSAALSTAFTTALQARVLGPCGELLSGLTVTFTAPASGASATFPNGASAVTNAQGIATVNVSANGSAGSYQVTATTASIPGVFSLTNTGGAPTPASMTTTMGALQSTIVNTAFGVQLMVTVLDGSSNPISGVTVTFAAPTSGARAILSGNGSVRTQSVGGRRAQGMPQGTSVITATDGTAFVNATANTIAGEYNVTATVAAITPVNFDLTNLAGAVATITVTSGTPQLATVNTGFGAQLVVTLLDSYSNPVPSAMVTFAAPGSGASASLFGGKRSQPQSAGGRRALGPVQSGATTAFTASDGTAVVNATANTIAGVYSVSATANAFTPVSFSLTNTAGPPATVALTAGGSQSTVVNTVFTTQLQVLVRDTFGNPVSGATVTFAAPPSSPSATILPLMAVTGSDGTASTTVTANTTAGGYNVTATVNGVAPFSIALVNNAGAPTRIFTNADGSQSTLVNTAFTNTLTVSVRDAFNNQVPGVTVTFVPPVSGASATLVPSTPLMTNSQGQATVAATANTVSGAYNVLASINAVNPTTIGLINVPGPAFSVTATAGAPQSTVVATAFTTNLQLIVKDSYSNPVPGVTVTFAEPVSGASASVNTNPTVVQPESTMPGSTLGPTLGLTPGPTPGSTLGSKRVLGQPPAPGTVVTNSGGRVSVRATANMIAGAYAVTATVNGLTPASYALTNTVGAVAHVTILSGSGQSAVASTAFLNSFQVTVTDTFGNAMSGVTVNFTGSGLTPGAGSATTNVNGVASMTATAGTVAGSSTLIASVNGQSATFTLTVQRAAAATITIVSGSGQLASLAKAFLQPFSVIVKDAFGNPATSSVVSFSAPLSGASGTFSANGNIVIDANGSAVSPIFTANNVAGSYNVTATVIGTQVSTSFTLTNQGGASLLTAVSPATTSPVAGSPVTLQAKVTDAAGLALSGVAVLFTPGGTSLTNASGIASMTFAAGTAAISTTVTASSTGTAQQLVYTMNIVAGPATNVKFLNLSGSSGSASGGLPVQLSVTDQYGNPVAGAIVTFAVQTGGGSVAPASATTNASGAAIVSWTLGAATGSNTLLASIAGLAPAMLQVTAISTPTLLPKLVVLPNTLAMNAVQGGSNPASVNLVVSNTGTGSVSGSQSLVWTVQPGAPSWIIPSLSTGSTPSGVTLSFNTSGLMPGNVSGQITFVAGTQSQTVNVQLNLAPIQNPGLSVLPQMLYYVASGATTLAAPGNAQLLAINNTGTGTLSWTASSATPWISVSPSSGTAPSQVVVTVNSAGLPMGSTSGMITFVSNSGSTSLTSQVSVLLQVNPAQPHLLVAPRLLTYSGPVGGFFASQPLQISTDLPVTATYTAGDSTTPAWLSLTPPTGAIPATLTTAVNTTSLPVGIATASVPIALSIGIFDRVEVLVSIASATDRPSMLLTDGNALTGGMLLVAQTGGNPVTRNFFVKSNNGATFSWTAIASGGAWLSVSPGTGSGTGTITVSANPASLTPGVYQGQVAVASPDTVQAAQLIGVTLLVTPAHQVPAEAVQATGTTTAFLAALSPGGQFVANVSDPIALQAALMDSLGNPITGAIVSVSINGASNPIILRDTGAGIYESVWTPLAAGDVALTFSSTSASDTDFRSGTVTSLGIPLPVLFRNAAVNAASFLAGTPLVAGSLGTVFGSNLTPVSSLKINNIAAPMLYSGAGQINFQIPQELAGQTSAMIQVTVAGQVALLDGVALAPIGPGVFAIIHQSGALADINAPATAGEVLSIYATGMGVVNNSPATGVAAVDASSTTIIQPVVSIGGQTAVVGYSGMAPGFIGLYQINVTVPAGVTGSALAVGVSVGGIAANGVTIAVK